jgi:type II secretory pathway component PulJ
VSEIITLTDIIESKIRKEKELEQYYEHLQELQRKIAFLEQDLKITLTCIRMIENETVVEVQPFKDGKVLDLKNENEDEKD